MMSFVKSSPGVMSETFANLVIRVSFFKYGKKIPDIFCFPYRGFSLVKSSSFDSALDSHSVWNNPFEMLPLCLPIQ